MLVDTPWESLRHDRKSRNERLRRSEEAVLLMSDEIREAQFSALVCCKWREGFHTLLRRHLQKINRSQAKRDVKLAYDEESCLMLSRRVDPV